MSKLWTGKATIEQNLAKQLPKMARRYFKKGSKALQPGRSWDEIHDFRLASKRFRYTLEIFLPLYGSGLEPYIEKLKGVQQLLGEVNDAVTAAGLLEGLPDSQRARARLARRAEVKTQKLRTFWAENFGGEESPALWEQYLGSFGRAEEVQKGA